MSLQAIIDTWSKDAQVERSALQMTLGELIQALKLAPDDLLVKFKDGSTPNYFDSYRGYYCDLALSSTIDNAPVTVRELLMRASNCVGATFEGYKGGEYVMNDNTPVWNASYGNCGDAIVDCVVYNNEFILITKRED